MSSVEIYYYNLDMTGLIHNIVGASPVLNANSNWINFGAAIGNLQNAMWKQAYTWYYGRP